MNITEAITKTRDSAATCAPQRHFSVPSTTQAGCCHTHNTSPATNPPTQHQSITEGGKRGECTTALVQPTSTVFRRALSRNRAARHMRRVLLKMLG